jgi:hypothetical protein
MEAFQYSSLPVDNEADTTRVIEIQPGYDQQPITCLVKHVRLTEPPPYEALSYSWGDPTPSFSVYCDGKHLAISKSLYIALGNLRSTTTSRVLWADAICINQQDLAERGQQVRLMRKVYEKAARVIVWLGEEAENSKLGFCLIPKLVAANKKRTASGDRRTFLHLQDVGIRAVYNLPNRRGGEHFPAYFRIFKRPWFGRGWVVQEVAVATSIVVCCGSSTVDFDDFMISLIFVNEMGILSDFDTKNTARLFEMALTRLAFKQGQGQGLIMLLLRHSATLMTDPRDKVYAFCGMAADTGLTGYTDREGLDIQPDYSASVEDAYRDLTMRILSRERTLAILYVPKDPGQISQFDLPSWVPDLSLPTDTASLTGVEHNYSQPCRYKAAADSQCYPRFTENNTVLGLQGFVFDSIIEVGEHEPIMHGDDDSFSPIKTLSYAFNQRRRAHNWRELAGVNAGFLWHEKYVTGEDIEDVFWQTHIAGFNPGRHMTPEKMETLSKSWIKTSRKRAWLRRLPYPFFEAAIILGMVIKGSWMFFRLMFWLAFWTPEQDYGSVTGCLVNRRLFRTKLGYIGVACYDARAGDAIAVFQGGRLPLVVRRKGERWRLIGDCYLHGIMQGEAYNEGKCELMWFV